MGEEGTGSEDVPGEEEGDHALGRVGARVGTAPRPGEEHVREGLGCVSCACGQEMRFGGGEVVFFVEEVSDEEVQCRVAVFAGTMLCRPPNACFRFLCISNG